jgi:hypothetical protein
MVGNLLDEGVWYVGDRDALSRGRLDVDAVGADAPHSDDLAGL